MKTVLILVDGPAGVGKGTLAKRLAAHFGFRHIDSGLIYRAVGVLAEKTGDNPVDIAMTLTPNDLSDEDLDLRSDKAGKAASKVGSIPEVRGAINTSLRRLVSEPPGTVMDGRAGAYEFPDAQVKIYLTATDVERAARRCQQFEKGGLEPNFGLVLKDMKERDKVDSERTVSPMKPGPGAVVVDNTKATKDETFAEAVRICEECLRSSSPGRGLTETAVIGGELVTRPANSE